MADVITRFKLETTQYDSKLRDAAKGLKEVAHQAELGGKGFTGFNQKAIEAARSLGTIESGANNTKDRLKDLVGSFNDAAKAYNNLSKEQQQSDFGKALSQSLEQLQQRIKDTKQELYGLGNTVEEVKQKSGGLFGEGGFTGMLQVAGGNLLASGIQKLGSEMVDTIQQSIELARQGEGIRMAFERLNRPGLLDHLKEATHGTVSEIELMQQAIKFENFKLPLEDLATYLAFAQQKAKDTGESIDYLVTSIVNGLGRQSKQILDNLGISAAELTKRMSDGADMTKAVADIIREEMEKAGDYVETAADRAARKQAELADKSEELGRRLMEASEKADEFNMTLKLGTLQVLAETYEGLQVLGNAADSVGRQIKKAFEELGIPINQIKNFVIELATELENTKIVGVSALGAIKTAAAGLISPLMGVVTLLREIGKEANKNGDAVLGAGIAGSIGGTVFNKPTSAIPDSSNTNKKGKGGNTGKKEKPKTEYEQNEAAIKALANEYAKLASSEKALTNEEEQRMSAIQAQIAILQERNKKYKEYFDIVQGNTVNNFKEGEIGMYEEELQKLQQSMKHAESADEAKEISQEIEILTIKIKELRGEYDKIFEKGNFNEILKATKELEKLNQLENTADANGNVVVNGKQKTGINSAFEQSTLTNTNVGAFISAIQKELGDADVGGVVYEKLTERLKDASMFKDVLQAMIDGGIKGADFTDLANEMKAKLLEGDISDEAWNDFLKRINEKISDSGLKLKVEVDDKGTIVGITTQTEKMTKDWQKAGHAIQAVGSAMSQIENPAAKVMGTLAQAVATVALSFAKALANSKSPWEWIAFAATGLATMVSTIATIKSTAKYSEGGIIQGNSYSGDNILGHVNGGGFVGLNAQEIVLNKAQQGNLATQLSDNALNGGSSTPYVMGEQIYLGVNTYLKRSGRGELVTSKR